MFSNVTETSHEDIDYRQVVHVLHQAQVALSAGISDNIRHVVQKQVPVLILIYFINFLPKNP